MFAAVENDLASSQGDDRHDLVVLALADVVALDLTIATHVFGHGDVGYRVRVASADGRPVRTTSGFTISVDEDLTALRDADTVLVPGYDRRAVPHDVLHALRGAATRGARVASICSGAFALAEAGLLDGLAATTHWAQAGDLARLHPRVAVQPGVLYVDAGRVLTSAGVAAGIDLCLHIIELDHGRAAAVERARHVVAPLHRAGGQAQFVPPAVGGPLAGGGSGSQVLAEVLAWALDHLDEPLTINDLARRALMSPRSFCRAVTRATGVSPHRWLTLQRLRTACRLLEDPAVTVERVAQRSGLGSTVNLRKHFRVAYGTTPVAYRAAFTSVASPGAGAAPLGPAPPGATGLSYPPGRVEA